MFHTPPQHHAYPLAQPAQVEIAPTSQAPDFILANHGSILVVTPISEAARTWFDEHIDPSAPRWAGGVAIEPRYWDAIEVGILNEGLSIG